MISKLNKIKTDVTKFNEDADEATRTNQGATCDEVVLNTSKDLVARLKLAWDEEFFTTLDSITSNTNILTSNTADSSVKTNLGLNWKFIRDRLNEQEAIYNQAFAILKVIK